MVKVFEGKIKGKGRHIGIVVSRFNEFITNRLLKGCLKELTKLGVTEKQITIVRVPGSFEIPVAALKLAQKKSIGAVICLGAVIRGETLHFELVARGASEGMTEVSLMTKKPVIFGVLTCDRVDQAYKRSDDKGDNKGTEAARNALEMIDLLQQIKN